MIRRWLVPALFWSVALAVAIGSYGLTNDQFGRISPARQIAAYGELPFRDYFDPGYYLTELSSAVLQRLLGYNLLGELLLNTVFIATGSLLVMMLVRRVSGSTVAGIVAASIALVAMPRAYDYDKVLFYPLGLLVLWRYLEAPRLGRLIALAATIVTAGLFRYDNGVYLTIAVLVSIVVTNGISRVAGREVGTLMLTALLLSTPVLVFVQINGGLADAIDQILTYGVREGARTRLTTLPRMVPGRWNSIDPPTAGQRVVIRWTPAVNTSGRSEAAARLDLHDEMPVSPEARTWSYLVLDESSEHVRRVVNDPAVEDTARINRQEMRLDHPTSAWQRLARRVPLLRMHLLPDFWSDSNAEAVLFYVLVALPVIALVVLIASSRTLTTTDVGSVAALIALSVLLDGFILREPIGARVGGMAGPATVMAAWIVSRIPKRGAMILAAWFATVVVVTFTVLTALSVTGDWVRTLAPVLNNPGRVTDAVRVMSVTPPSLAYLPAGRDEAMASYVKRCTQSTDRVYASWFFPELYWFAQRPFAGRMAYTFGHHWSEPRFQERSIRSFQAHPVPLVLIDAANYGEFRDVYRLLDAYFASRYRVGGESNFGDSSMPQDAYRILVSNDRVPTGIDSQWGLPCFG